MKPENTKDIGDQMKLNLSKEAKKSSPKLPSNISIPEVDEEWGNQLWEAVNKTYGKEKGSETKPPIEELDLEQKTLKLEMRSEYGGVGSEVSQGSKADSFKTLPSYLGEYETNSEVKKLPTLKVPSLKTLNISSLSMLLSAPIKCTLPLADLLRARPEMWEEVARYLKTIGVDIPMAKINHL